MAQEIYVDISGMHFNVGDWIVLRDETTEEKHTVEVEAAPVVSGVDTRVVRVRVVSSTAPNTPTGKILELTFDAKIPFYGAVIRYDQRTNQIPNAEHERHCASELYKWMSRNPELKNGVKFSRAIAYLQQITAFDKAPANSVAWRTQKRQLSGILKLHAEMFISKGGWIYVNRQPPAFTKTRDPRVQLDTARKKIDYKKLMQATFLMYDSGAYGPVEWENLPDQ